MISSIKKCSQNQHFCGVVHDSRLTNSDKQMSAIWRRFGYAEIKDADREVPFWLLFCGFGIYCLVFNGVYPKLLFQMVVLLKFIIYLARNVCF